MASENFREIPLSSPAQRAELSRFMESQGIRLDGDVKYACAFTDEDGAIIASGCHAGNILKGFAVSPEARGQNLLGRRISMVMAHQATQGHFRLRVFTSPDKVPLFMASGFRLVAAGTEAALFYGAEKPRLGGEILSFEQQGITAANRYFFSRGVFGVQGRSNLRYSCSLRLILSWPSVGHHSRRPRTTSRTGKNVSKSGIHVRQEAHVVLFD